VNSLVSSSPMGRAILLWTFKKEIESYWNLWRTTKMPFDSTTKLVRRFLKRRNLSNKLH